MRSKAHIVLKELIKCYCLDTVPGYRTWIPYLITARLLFEIGFVFKHKQRVLHDLKLSRRLNAIKLSGATIRVR
jgi:hypothetical protein